MKVGYARVSTQGQDAGFEDQQRQLMEYGCKRIVTEKVSSVAHRAGLVECLAGLQAGDVLVVCKLDRLARSTRNLLDIVDDLSSRGIDLCVLNMGGERVDTRSATGKLMLTLLGAVAEFERGMIHERMTAGIEKARSEGKYRGRKLGSSPHRDAVLTLTGAGKGPSEIARELGINRATVHRIVASAQR